MKNLFTILIAILTFNIALFAFSGKGSGTENNPYQIETLSQLSEMSDDLKAHYILMNDIDATDTKNWNSGKGWKPIGNINNGFKGSFDGNKHKITYLYIDRPDEQYIGLFGVIDYSPNVTIKNLELKYLQYKGLQLIGGIAGEVLKSISTDAKHIIKNCYVNGEIESSTQGYVGGITGKINQYVLIKYCKVNVLLRAKHNIGGIVGHNGAGEIYSCIAEGAIYGTSTLDCNAGGIAGNNAWGTIEKSSADVDIDVSGSVAGGLIGKTTSGTVKNCFARGTVTGVANPIGGLIGTLYSDIYYCYSKGDVSPKNKAQFGGLIGVKGGGGSSTNYCYWDIETSGYTTSASGNPKTTAEMKTQSTYSNWDFDNTWAISTNQNEGYPDLKWKYQAELVKPTLLLPTNDSTDIEVATVAFDWSEVSNADNYYLQISKKLDFSEISMDATVTTAGASAKNLNRNTKYYWRVRAQNDITESAWSDVWSFTTEKVPVPSFLKVELVGEGIKLKWGNALTDAKFYIYRKFAGEDYDYNKPLAEMLPILEYVDKTVEGGNEYCYVVRAKFDDVFSDNSQEGCVEVPIQPPTQLSAELKDNGILLKWKASITSNITYNIYRKVENGEYDFENPLAKNLTTINYFDNSVEQKFYSYVVRAKKSGKESNNSKEVNIQVDFTKPNPPSYLVIDELRTKDDIPPYVYVPLSWGKVVGDNIVYDVYRSTNETTGYNKIIEGLVETHFVDFDTSKEILKYGVEYFYRVKARSPKNESDFSEVASSIEIEFRPYIHGFSFTNTEENMWPKEWWTANCDSQPYDDWTQTMPIIKNMFKLVLCSQFPDWNLWSNTWGYNVTNGKYLKNLDILNWLSNIQSTYKGSCYGFVTASLLEYNKKTYWKDTMNVSKMYSIELLPKNNKKHIIRNVINTFQQYNFYNDTKEHKAALENLNVNETIQELKKSFQIEKNSNSHSNRSLIFGWKNKNGKPLFHAVLPYKINQYLGVNDMVKYTKIYVYDPNYADEKKISHFTVDFSDLKGVWNYSNLNTDNYEKPLNFYPSVPVENYDGIFSRNNKWAPKIKQDKPILQSSDNLTNIYFSSEANVTIKNKNSEVVNNKRVFDITNPWATPIIPITGGETDVIGFYYFEDDGGEEIEIQYEASDKENNRISLMSDKSKFISTFSTTTIGQKQNYFIDQNKDSISVSAEGVNKNLNLAYINDSGTFEKTIGILNSTLSDGDNLTLHVLNKGDIFEINNFGDTKSYDIYFSQIDSDIDTAIFKSIALDANQKHQIWVKNWNDLRNSEVYIYKDNDFNGSIDDTLCLRCVSSVENDISKNINLNIYPNPASNSVKLDFTLVQKSVVQIEINDISGKIVFEKTFELLNSGSNSLELKDLDLINGVYLLTITSNKEKLTDRLIIHK